MAVALVAVGCGTGGKTTTAPTTSTTSAAATTAAPATTVAPPPSAVKGTDDASVATRLYNVANVAILADAQWACLIGRSAVGHLLVEAIGSPPANVYTGNVALTICNASSAQKMKRASG